MSRGSLSGREGFGSVGEMRDRIEIQKRVRVPSGDTDYTETFITVAKVWGKFEQAAARGKLDDATGGDSAGAVTHNILVRFSPGFEEPDLRYYAVRRGRRYRIMRTKEGDAKRRFLQLQCVDENDVPAPVGATEAPVNGSTLETLP